MNKQLIRKLSEQAIENISNKRFVSNQIERVWFPEAFNEELSTLVLHEVIKSIWYLDMDYNIKEKVINGIKERFE